MLRPRGDLFIRESEKLEDSASGLIRAGYDMFLLELSGVNYIGSSGIGVIVWLHQRLRQLEGRLILTSPPEKVRRVLEMMELTMLERAETEKEAFRALGKENPANNDN